MGVTNDKMHIYPNWNGNPEKDACVVEMPSSISAMAAEKCGGTCATRVCLPSGPAVPGDACWAGGHGVEDYSQGSEISHLVQAVLRGNRQSLSLN